MSLGSILLIILVLILVGMIPVWPHSRGWGYGASGLLAIILALFLILLLMGRIWYSVRVIACHCGGNGGMAFGHPAAYRLRMGSCGVLQDTSSEAVQGQETPLNSRSFFQHSCRLR